MKIQGYRDDPGRSAVVPLTVDITNLFHRKIRELVKSQEQNSIGTVLSPWF